MTLKDFFDVILALPHYGYVKLYVFDEEDKCDLSASSGYACDYLMMLRSRLKIGEVLNVKYAYARVVKAYLLRRNKVLVLIDAESWKGEEKA